MDLTLLLEQSPELPTNLIVDLPNNASLLSPALPTVTALPPMDKPDATVKLVDLASTAALVTLLLHVQAPMVVK